MISLKERTAACWAGKCLGGAAGMAYEGVPYRPGISGEDIVIQNVPNDDLELQLIWLIALETYGIELAPETLGKIWLKYIPNGCDEYCIALRNLRHGIMPPYSGYFDNCFADGMGATIRSEIWAAVFPGQPETAAKFASFDAMVDHWGEGVYGEIFMAAAESIAFNGTPPAEALNKALKYLPESSRCRKYIEEVFAACESGKYTAEEAIVWVSDHFRHANFTDCAMNLAVITAAVLWGNGDFISTVLFAINCGRDTDCTAASCGALLGIAYGMEAIPQKWLSKLHNELVFSPFIYRIPGIPNTLEETTSRTLALAAKLGKPASTEIPVYIPCSPAPRPDILPVSRWLVTELPQTESDKLADELLRTGRCPAELQGNIITTTDLQFELDRFAKNANTLDLFTFLTVEDPPETVVVSATCDVGHTLWFDRCRILNHHSRDLAIPSFHRAEGGAAFAYPLPDGNKILVHWRIYNCTAPLHCALMFGTTDNNHIECCKLNI